MDFLKKSEYIHTISNHPVHIIGENEVLSPSSLIPFCQFGDKVLGIKIPQFPVPVCNIFRPKILNDQLCYELDDTKLLFHLKNSNVSYSSSSLNKGLTLFIDNNEDRQYSWAGNEKNVEKNNGRESYHIFL